MKIVVENCYSDGHESQQTFDVGEFTGNTDDDDGLRDHVHDFTGDGHGARHRVEAVYTVTILEAANADLVGRVVEFD